MRPETQMFPLMLTAVLAVATAFSWSFLPDHGGSIPATLGIVCGCVALANLAAALVVSAARRSVPKSADPHG